DDSDRVVHGRRIGGRAPPVDDEGTDIGACCGEGLIKSVGSCTVMLYGNALTVHALTEEDLLDLCARLGFGDPVSPQSGRLNRSACLGAASVYPCSGEHRVPFFAKTRGFSHVAPTDESDS